MRILKPQHLSLMHRCFERQRRAYLGVAVMAYLPIRDEPALLPEQELWQEVAPLMQPEVPLDAVLPKSGAEFLMIGDACAPGGEPVTGLEVEARVGSLEVGKDADVLILDGDPLHYKTFVDTALVNGKVAYVRAEEPYYRHIRR